MYKGIFLLLLAEFTFALSTVFGKMVTNNSAIGGIEITFVRFAIGTLVAGLYMVFTHKSFRPNNLRHVVLRAVFNVTAVMLFFAGLERTTVTNANMLNMTYPAFVFLVAPFINGETTAGIFFISRHAAGFFMCADSEHQSAIARAPVGLVGVSASLSREARLFDWAVMSLPDAFRLSHERVFCGGLRAPWDRPSTFASGWAAGAGFHHIGYGISRPPRARWCPRVFIFAGAWRVSREFRSILTALSSESL